MRQEWSTDELVSAWTLVEADWPLVGAQGPWSSLALDALEMSISTHTGAARTATWVPRRPAGTIRQVWRCPATTVARCTVERLMRELFACHRPVRAGKKSP